MTELNPSERAIRQILIALDASPHSRAALEMAVQLATAFEANLKGLFIKDENLLQAAQLPFAQEVRSHSLPPKRLDDTRVERQLRYQAQRAEALLEDRTEQVEVSYDFEVVEGHVTEELLHASEDADLLAVGKTSTRSSRRRLGTTSRTLLSEASAPVLVLREPVGQPQPLITYYDGSDAAASALEMAVQVATRPPNRPLKVFLPPETESNLARLQDEVYRQFGSQVPHLQVRPLAPQELNRFARLARKEGQVLLVLPESCPALVNTPLDHFLYKTDRPLLVVR